MHFDDDSPKTTTPVTIGEDLYDFSIEELTERISLLGQEILRVEAEIVNKKSTKTDADSVFNL